MTLYKEPTEPLNHRGWSSRMRFRWTPGFVVGAARYVCPTVCVPKTTHFPVLRFRTLLAEGIPEVAHRSPSYRVALDGMVGQVGRHPPKGGSCGPGGDPRGRLYGGRGQDTAGPDF